MTRAAKLRLRFSTAMTGPTATLPRVGTFVAVMIFVVIALVVVVIVGSVVNRQKRQEREQQIQQLATSRGWRFIARDDSYGKRWKGTPFTNRGGTSNIVIGQHRGRNFCCFQYHYTTTSSTGSTTTTQSHNYVVHVIALPAAVPDLSVGAEGIFGGKVAEAFGFARVEINDPDFNNTFKVKSEDQAFGSLVLQPAVVDQLKAAGPWDWRFSGQDMISFQPGTFEPAMLQPRLDLMCNLLDRIPNDVWQRPQLPH